MDKKVLKEDGLSCILGIDENGLGPLMGPMTVTGTLIRHKNGTGRWRHLVCDSKKFFNSRALNSFAKLEETVMAIFRLLKSRLPESPREIAEAFCDRNLCMSQLNLCTNLPQSFAWGDPVKAEQQYCRISEWLHENEITLSAIRSHIICTKRLNNFYRKGGTKFQMDFLTFCTIIKSFSGNKNMQVECGKIAGMKYYTNHLRYQFPAFHVGVVNETADESGYMLENGDNRIGIRFLKDAEDSSFTAAVSSLAGKYLREITMYGIRRSLDIPQDISGYHDIKTRRTIDKMDLSPWPETCLFRKK